jgi:threonyl-tRNA synthetase
MIKHMQNNLEKIRHSLSHLMAQVIMEMWPEAKLAIGPVIANGFYYDFDLPRSLTPQDLQKIEQKMRKLISQNIQFQKLEKSAAEAKELSKKQPYKLELIEELVTNKQPITFYQNPYRGTVFIFCGQRGNCCCSRSLRVCPAK